MIGRALVVEPCDAGRRIDQRLLVDRDEPGARPVKVLDEQDDGAEQYSSAAGDELSL